VLRSPRLLALAYAIPTHLVLDILTDKGMAEGGGLEDLAFWPSRFRGRDLDGGITDA